MIINIGFNLTEEEMNALMRLYGHTTRNILTTLGVDEADEEILDSIYHKWSDFKLQGEDSE